MTIALVVFVIGLFLLFNSVAWGHAAANSYLRSQGGGMDGAQFAIVLQESINTFRWLGGILSLISGLGFVRAIELR
jgi:hypothetical protein